MKIRNDKTKQAFKTITTRITNTASEDDYYYYFKDSNNDETVNNICKKEQMPPFERKFRNYIATFLRKVNLSTSLSVHRFDTVISSLESGLSRYYKSSNKKGRLLSNILSKVTIEHTILYEIFETRMLPLCTEVICYKNIRKNIDILSILEKVSILQEVLSKKYDETRINYLATYVTQFLKKRLVFDINNILKLISISQPTEHLSPRLPSLNTSLEVGLIMNSLVNLSKKAIPSTPPLLEQLLGLRIVGEEREVLSQHRHSGRFPRSFSSVSNGVAIIVLRDSGEHLMSRWFNVVGFVALSLLMEIYGGSSSLEYWSLGESGNGGPESPTMVNSIDVRHLQSAGYRGKIHIFDLRRSENDGKNYFLSVMHNVFPTLYSRGPGFFIIVVSDENALVKLCSDLRIRLGSSSPVICLDPIGNIERYKSVLAEYLVFGVRSEELGNSFLTTIHDLRIALHDIIKELNHLSVFVRRQTGPDPESTDVHQFRLKVLTFAALVDHLWGKKKAAEPRSREEVIKVVKDIVESHKIEFETPIISGSDNVRIVPDIAFNDVNGERVCVEIETLVGSREPMKKVDETVWKYRDIIGGVCDEVWIVLEPVTALIHFEELMNRLIDYSIIDEQFKGRVKVKVLTIYSYRDNGMLRPYQVALRDLEEFGRELRMLLREFREKDGGDARVHDDR